MSAETRDFTTQKAWCPSHPGHRWGQRVPGEAKLHPEAQGLRNPPSPTPQYPQALLPQPVPARAQNRHRAQGMERLGQKQHQVPMGS